MAGLLGLGAKATVVTLRRLGGVGTTCFSILVLPSGCGLIDAMHIFIFLLFNSVGAMCVGEAEMVSTSGAAWALF